MAHHSSRQMKHRDGDLLKVRNWIPAQTFKPNTFGKPYATSTGREEKASVCSEQLPRMATETELDGAPGKHLFFLTLLLSLGSPHKISSTVRQRICDQTGDTHPCINIQCFQVWIPDCSMISLPALLSCSK